MDEHSNSMLQLTSLDRQEKAYGSLRMKLFDANQEAVSCLDFLYRIKRAVCSSGLFTAFLGLLLVLPVSMILVGSSYRDECPEEPKIVIYLLVTGCTGTLKLLLSIWRQLAYRRCQKCDGYYEYDDDDDDDDDAIVVTRMLRFTNNFLSVFLLIWFVLGNMWVFRIWWPNFSGSLHRPMEWCNYTVYIFCVAHIIFCHVMAGLVFFVLLCLLCFYLCTPLDQD